MKTLADRFRRWYDHERDSNAKCLEMLNSVPAEKQNTAEFQKAVDKVFSFGGFRGEEAENPVHLARNFRRLAGFSEDEISELVDIAAEAFAEAQAVAAAGVPQA